MYPMLCAVSDEKFERFMHTYTNASDQSGGSDQNVRDQNGGSDQSGGSDQNVSDQNGGSGQSGEIIGEKKSGCKEEATQAVAMLFNRKYLGFLEWILHEITEFIALACGPDHKGEVSAHRRNSG